MCAAILPRLHASLEFEVVILMLLHLFLASEICAAYERARAPVHKSIREPHRETSSDQEDYIVEVDQSSIRTVYVIIRNLRREELIGPATTAWTCQMTHLKSSREKMSVCSPPLRSIRAASSYELVATWRGTALVGPVASGSGAFSAELASTNRNDLVVAVAGINV
jgi:hypothetical protein